MRELVYTELLRGTIVDRREDLVTPKGAFTLETHHDSLLGRHLNSAGFSLGVRCYIALCMVIGISLYLALRVADVPCALLLSCIVLWEIAWFTPRECAVRCSRRSADGIPQLLDTLTKYLSRGDCLDRAFASAVHELPVGTLRKDLGAVQDRMLRGASLAQALHELSDLRRVHDFRVLAISVQIFAGPAGVDGEALRQIAGDLQRYRGRCMEIALGADRRRAQLLSLLSSVGLIGGSILMHQGSSELIRVGLPLLCVWAIVVLRATSSVSFEGYE